MKRTTDTTPMPRDKRCTYGVYPIDMLHIVRIQFDNTMGVTISNLREMDDQDDNDAEEVR